MPSRKLVLSGDRHLIGRYKRRKGQEMQDMSGFSELELEGVNVDFLPPVRA
jgi:hypothetical protein